LYLFCLIDEPVEAPLLAGLQDQPVRILSIGNFSVVVSDFHGNQLEPSKENIVIHEHVIEKFMDKATPLPFRFGSVSSESNLHRFIGENADTLKADLEKVRGCVEMGLKVMTAPFPVETTPQSGTEFLEARKRQLDLQTSVSAIVEAAAVGLIRKSDVSLVRKTARPMVRIAHLVLRYHLNEYKSHIDELVRQRAEWAFLRSGPWPPYSFVTAPRVP
jgi:gas vesicle protein GvpL/GvpF